MTRLRFAVGAIALAFSFSASIAPASGQVITSGSSLNGDSATVYVTLPSGKVLRVTPTVPVDANGNVLTGGGGDASATNQTSQITLEQSIRDEIGAISGTPTANTLQGRLEAMRVLLAAPVLASGAATSVLQGTINSSIGTLQTTLHADMIAPTPAGSNLIGGVDVRTPAATSTPLSWSVSTTTTVGPWTPQTGRAIYLTKTSTDTATINVTVTTTGACAGGVPLMAANFSYSAGNLVSTSTKGREQLDPEQSTAAQYCVTITPGTNGVTSSGSLSQ
ncbi:hypothetical protein GCM10008023_06130 [Sphingomonas glacialis]|uniref:Uncharacterized protein n=1 Tax=Sphingomonas glacialis TaxID=658225 RepID=A0ABQ3L9E9_9SPHN|nr:hypothetical protein [Sphingomonas glacialis]GHH09444.1 hypothetical protein GCM10008023_06130 [Sphingomonas glacialis]